MKAEMVGFLLHANDMLLLKEQIGRRLKACFSGQLICNPISHLYF